MAFVTQNSEASRMSMPQNQRSPFWTSLRSRLLDSALWLVVYHVAQFNTSRDDFNHEGYAIHYACNFHDLGSRTTSIKLDCTDVGLSEVLERYLVQNSSLYSATNANLLQTSPSHLHRSDDLYRQSNKTEHLTNI